MVPGADWSILHCVSKTLFYSWAVCSPRLTSSYPSLLIHLLKTRLCVCCSSQWSETDAPVCVCSFCSFITASPSCYRETTVINNSEILVPLLLHGWDILSIFLWVSCYLHTSLSFTQICLFHHQLVCESLCAASMKRSKWVQEPGLVPIWRTKPLSCTNLEPSAPRRRHRCRALRAEACSSVSPWSSSRFNQARLRPASQWREEGHTFSSSQAQKVVYCITTREHISRDVTAESPWIQLQLLGSSCGLRERPAQQLCYGTFWAWFTLSCHLAAAGSSHFSASNSSIWRRRC